MWRVRRAEAIAAARAPRAGDARGMLRAPMAFDRVASLRSFIARKPDDPFPRYGLAMELKSRGDLAASATAFDELIAAFPDYVPAYLMAAGVYGDVGRKDDARATLQKGIEVATTKGDAHAKKELEAALAEAGG